MRNTLKNNTIATTTISLNIISLLLCKGCDFLNIGLSLPCFYVLANSPSLKVQIPLLIYLSCRICCRFRQECIRTTAAARFVTRQYCCYFAYLYKFSTDTKVLLFISRMIDSCASFNAVSISTPLKKMSCPAFFKEVSIVEGIGPGQI